MASNPASLQKQCNTVQAQLGTFRAVQAAPLNYVTMRGAAPVFLTSLREVQSTFSCAGVDTGACQAVNDLVAQLRGYVILFPEESATPESLANRNGIIANRVKGSAGTVLNLLGKLKTALKCS